MNVIFFLGPHKSGTSSLQRLFRENIQSRSIKYIDQHVIKDTVNKDLFKNITHANHLYYQGKLLDDSFHDKLKIEFKEILLKFSNFKEVILFNENILGPMIGHIFSKNNVCKEIYPSYEILLDVLISLRDDFDLKISSLEIIVIKRDFYKWIISVANDNNKKSFKNKLSNNEESFLSVLDKKSIHRFYELFKLKGITVIEFDNLINISEANHLKEFLKFDYKFIKDLGNKITLKKDNPSNRKIDVRFKQQIFKKLQNDS